MAFSSSFALGKLSNLLKVPIPDISIGPWDVIQSIESVHQVPLMPILVPVSREYITDGEGAYYDAPGKPLRIVVIPTATCPELTLVHDLGHLIDHQLLGTSWRYASADPSLLVEWRQKIQLSEAVQRLRSTLTSIQQGVNEFEVELSNGRVDVFRFAPGLRLNIDVVQYLLKPYELFARSYAQYIVSCSQHNILETGLDAQRNSSIENVIPKQWEDEDFAPIAEVFDTMFRERGWKL